MFDKLREEIECKIQPIKNEYLKTMIRNCFFDTIDHCLKDKGEFLYISTGDIEAMWLRDSVAQVLPYADYLNDPEIQELFRKLLYTLFSLILLDPYANSFMEDQNMESIWKKDFSNFKHPLVWERKFELDSLTYPLWLICCYYQKTKDISVFDETFYKAFKRILQLIQTEMHHSSQSDYYFFRFSSHPVFIPLFRRKDNDSLLIWSAFRPSDDLSQLHYNIPQNMFLVSVLTTLSAIFKEIGQSTADMEQIIKTVRNGIEKQGIVESGDFGKIYVYETNQKGKALLMDDANIPSLLSIPYFHYPFLDNDVYNNTRRFILSERNPYYFKGTVITGIGSPHTGKNQVWPMSLIVEAMTCENIDRKKEILKMLINSTDFCMHESIHKDDKNQFTRVHFGWANALFAQLALANIDLLKELYDET